MLTVQVKGGDSQTTTASKASVKANRPQKQTKVSTSMLPPSTNISSPMTKSKKQKGKARATVIDENESDEEAYVLQRNGYAEDNFVVADDSFDDDNDDDDDLDEMPVSRRKRQKGRMGPPIAEDAELASINEIHRDMIGLFEQDAVLMAAELQNLHSLRKPVFTRQQLRVMAAQWTLTLDQMANIPGIDQAKVETFGRKFLPKLKEYRAQYRDLFGDNPAGTSSKATARRVSAQSIVDLVSTDDDDDEEMEDAGLEEEGEEDDGEESHYFGGKEPQPPPSVRRWNAEMDELEKKSAVAASRSRSTSSTRGGAGRFGRGGRKTYRRSSGSQKPRAGAGVKKRQTGKKSSTGSARSTSGGFASGSRVGRGGSRGGGSAVVETMPH
jgi:bloom syndrome protein